MANQKLTRYKQEYIRRLIQKGLATDLTKEKPIQGEALEKLGYSIGQYGLNGAVFIGRKTKKLYAVPIRASILFMYW